jgi:hypothetical protein
MAAIPNGAQELSGKHFGVFEGGGWGTFYPVTPLKNGVQFRMPAKAGIILDSGFRRNDGTKSSSQLCCLQLLSG